MINVEALLVVVDNEGLVISGAAIDPDSLFQVRLIEGEVFDAASV